MSHIEPRQYGAPHITLDANPRAILAAIKRANPTASEKQVPELLMSAVLGEAAIAAIEMPDEARAIFQYFVTNHTRSIARYEPEAAPEVLIERATERRTKKQEREVSTRVAAAAVSQIILLDLAMPNGKSLRDCTFKEVRGFGVGFAKLATMGKPAAKVGTISETKVRSAFN